MSATAQRIRELGLVLPAPMSMAGLPFRLVRIHGDRAYVAGHVPLGADGRIAQPLGHVGAEVTPEQAHAAARLCALGMIASLQDALGDLDRIVAWLRVFGMVRAAAGFTAIPAVINGASQTIIEVFGAERGAHARSAVGMAELPMGVPVEVEAEVAIRT